MLLAILTAFAFSVPDPVHTGPACPTINPPGTSCAKNKACIRMGGECAITVAVPPIVCECVI